MLSLLKKKSDANALQVPAWHPNFRNFQRLPDTKVVRTAFFVNVIAITAALALVIYVGSREWELRSLRLQIADKQEQIDRNKSGSDQAVALFKKYQAEEAKIAEVTKFVESKLIVSELLTYLGQTLPANIALDRFELRDDGLTLGATVRGATEEASALATSYIEQLRTDSSLKQFDEIKQTRSDRNPANGRIMIEIFLRLKSAAGNGGKK